MIQRMRATNKMDLRVREAILAERAACAAEADRYKKFHLARTISRAIKARSKGE